MDTDEGFRRFEAARVRGELTVQELWTRYLALGGHADEFDIDGYLQGLVGLDAFEQVILAVALNEQLDDVHRAARIPLPASTTEEPDRDALKGLVEELLRDGSSKPP
jgi:hypothetical protein